MSEKRKVPDDEDYHILQIISAQPGYIAAFLEEDGTIFQDRVMGFALCEGFRGHPDRGPERTIEPLVLEPEEGSLIIATDWPTFFGVFGGDEKEKIEKMAAEKKRKIGGGK